MKHVATVLALATLVSGCVTPRAQTPVERPTLDVPPVPPRVIDPAPPPDRPQTIEPVAELPAEKVSSPPAKPRASSPRESRETAKPDAPKADIPPVEPPPALPAAAPSGQPIRTPGTLDAAAADRRIREILKSTQGVLNGIDYQRLRRERQAAYDQAKSHIEGAEAALKDSNFDLAKELADKAEKLARELQTR